MKNKSYKCEGFDRTCKMKAESNMRFCRECLNASKKHFVWACSLERPPMIDVGGVPATKEIHEYVENIWRSRGFIQTDSGAWMKKEQAGKWIWKGSEFVFVAI